MGGANPRSDGVTSFKDVRPHTAVDTINKPPTIKEQPFLTPADLSHRPREIFRAADV